MEHLNPKLLQERRDLYVRYLQDRVTAEDWHGVMDAAADLREIDVALKIAVQVRENNKLR